MNMNNNPIGYNQGMDSNVFGMNVLRNDGTSQVEANPTLNLLNQSATQFGGPSTGNPTIDLLNQGGGAPSQNNTQFYNSGNPTLDLLNESNVQNSQNNGYSFVAPEAPVESQPNTGGAFNFLSGNDQAMNPQFGSMAPDNSFNPQPEVNTMVQGMMETQPQMAMFQPEQPMQPMNSMMPQQNIPNMQQSIPETQPNSYGFVPMMNQQQPEPVNVPQPVAQDVVQQMNPQPATQGAVQMVNQNPSINNSIGIVDELNFSFIPLREEAPAPVPQPVIEQIPNQPTAAQVFGQAQVMQPSMSQPVNQPMNNGAPMMPQQGMPNMQPQMGTFQPMMQTGVVQQSLDTLFPNGVPEGNGNFPQ